MNDIIIKCIICGAIPLISIPISLIICKCRIHKAIQKAIQVKSNAEIDNGYKCQICGALFKLNKASRYLIADDEAPIMAMFIEPATYECFDCPKCGCQNRVNERKGGCIIDEQTKADKDLYI